MPLEVIESTDPLASLIHLETSTVYEMIMSLHVLLKPERRAAWVQEARASLPSGFLNALDEVYRPFARGTMFFELAVDYDDAHDVPGFIEYVRQMDPARFIFYIVGRIVSPEAIAASRLEPDALIKTLQTSPLFNGCMCTEVPLGAILDDVPGFQARLADLLARYWEIFFEEQAALLPPHWERALNDKQALLARSGGQALWEHITGRTELLPPLPEGYPVQEIVFLPVYLIAAPVYIFYGYGKISVLFDSERTQSRTVEIEQTKERALAVFKALSDSSRLDILRMIAYFEGEYSGKQLAAKTKLSPSAVSRHLAQLRDAGLIVEESSDNRTLTYWLQRDTLSDLSELLSSFLNA